LGLPEVPEKIQDYAFFLQEVGIKILRKGKLSRKGL
jgi:hypothetical protein